MAILELRAVLILSALLPVSVSADMLLVSESGTWGSTVPTSTYTAPNASFSYSFLVDSNPSVSSYETGLGFEAPFSSFTYTLAGNTVATTPVSIGWYSENEPGSPYNPGGLFNLDFSDAIFVITGAQAYLGPESAPTILTGVYPLSGTAYLALSTPLADVPISGDVVISSVPEPSSLLLLLTVCVLSVGVKSRLVGVLKRKLTARLWLGSA